MNNVQVALELLESLSAQKGGEIGELINYIQDYGVSVFQRKTVLGHEKGVYIEISASTWLQNSKGHLLLLQNKKLGDRWLPPGGHADGDCDLKAVAIKKLFEETGVYLHSCEIEAFRVDKIFFDKSVFGYQKILYDICFQAQLPEEQKPEICEPEKHAKLRWFSHRKAETLMGKGIPSI